ncbi:hypothetical protein [Micromonospora carbonacea]|uniref:hypothetical protein n=1 Tax=Micromonospora carbonacea TaxID=47853 RepID=UPI00159F1449|nr:hypothetical protein [Micromonospora carbonacea]
MGHPQRHHRPDLLDGRRPFDEATMLDEDAPGDDPQPPAGPQRPALSGTPA